MPRYYVNPRSILSTLQYSMVEKEQRGPISDQSPASNQPTNRPTDRPTGLENGWDLFRDFIRTSEEEVRSCEGERPVCEKLDGSIARLDETRTESCSNYPARWPNRIEVLLDIASDKCRFLCNLFVSPRRSRTFADARLMDFFPYLFHVKICKYTEKMFDICNYDPIVDKL